MRYMWLRLPAGAYFGLTASTFSAPTFRLSESQYEERERLRLHAHENAHFCWVLRGSYSEELEGRTVERRPGDLMFYPAGVPHAESHRDANRHFLIELSPQLATVAVADPRQVRTPVSRSIVTRLYRELVEPDAFSALAAEGFLLELLAHIGRLAKERSANGSAWMRRVEDFLRCSFTEQIGLGEAAAVAGVHPVHLARVFRRQHGCSIGTFVRRARIDAARDQLTRSDASVAEIAMGLGFADQSHFHRTFKRVTGMTPTQFRMRSQLKGQISLTPRTARPR